MSDDPCEDICDAIVGALKEPDADRLEILGLTEFSLQFEPSKPDNPNAELEKILDTVRVLVWPHGETEVKIGRGGEVVAAYSVAMLVIREIAVDFPRTKLAKLTRELKRYLRGLRMAVSETNTRGFVYSGAETTLTDLGMIYEHHKYACITIFTYSGTR